MGKLWMISLVFFIGCGTIKKAPVREAQLLSLSKKMYEKETKQTNDPYS